MIQDNSIESYIKENDIKIYDIKSNHIHSIVLKNEYDFIELAKNYNTNLIFREYSEKTTINKTDIDVDYEELQQLLEKKYKYLEAVSDIISEDEYITKLDGIINKNLRQYDEPTEFKERWLEYSFFFSESCCYKYIYYESEGVESEDISHWEVTNNILSDSAEDITSWGDEIVKSIKNEYELLNEKLLNDTYFLTSKTKDSRALLYDEFIDKNFPYLSMAKNEPGMLKKLPNYFFAFDKKTRSLYAERLYEKAKNNK